MQSRVMLLPPACLPSNLLMIRCKAPLHRPPMSSLPLSCAELPPRPQLDACPGEDLREHQARQHRRRLPPLDDLHAVTGLPRLHPTGVNMCECVCVGGGRGGCTDGEQPRVGCCVWWGGRPPSEPGGAGAARCCSPPPRSCSNHPPPPLCPSLSLPLLPLRTGSR